MSFAYECMQGGLSAGTAKALGGHGASGAAAGTSQATGTVPKSSILIATGADGTKGITLPAMEIGDECWVFNNSGSTLKVYPPSGSAIPVTGTGLGTADAAYSLLTYKTGLFKCQSATQLFLIVT